MRDILISNGFLYLGNCNCGGTLTEKYKRDNYMIKVYPRIGKFGLYINNELQYKKPAIELLNVINGL